MKKFIVMMLCVALALGAMVGCAKEQEQPVAGDTPSASQETEGTQEETTMEGAINVCSREDGSGTRGAFIELLGIEQKDESGEKVDMTTPSAEITNSTSVMMTTVAGNPAAIGYISLGSLDDSVKALKIDGVEATAENVENGTYPIARPFNIATKGEAEGVVADFIDFILSADGSAIIEQEGYIPAGAGEAYEGGEMSGTITISGSSSVTPVMEVLKEAYETLNPDVTIELQQSDSTTGMNDAMQGVSDIGMASRELKEEELAELTPVVIAMDGIAVIVNNENPLAELTAEQVKNIYVGDVTEWSEL